MDTRKTKIVTMFFNLVLILGIATATATATALSVPSAALAASFPIASGWAGAGVASDGINFLVAQESDTSTAKVAAQLMSPAGVKIGSAVALGIDGQSCCASGVAFDGTNYLVAWEDDQGIKNSPTPFLVYGQFINASGATVGTAFAMTTAGIWFDGVNMLAYGSGKYLLTYTRLIVPANGDASTNRYVAGRIISPDGTMGSEFRISTGYGNGSSVTSNGENFFVVWKEDSLDQEVRGRFVSPTGALLNEISINASPAPSDNPVTVAFDGTNYLVVFNDEIGATQANPTYAWDVLGQRVRVSDGMLVGGVITISNDPGAQMATSVAFNGTNHLVTWIDMKNDANGNGVCDIGEGSCWDVYGQIVGKDGVLVSSKFAITTDPGNQMGGIGCFGGKCMALVSSGIVMGQGGPMQVGEVYGVFLTSALNFVSGWNLVGNSINAPLDVAIAFGDPLNVTTVWKWIPATSKWAFYAPSMTAPNLATYAAGKGYDVLSTINGGEGFWVNAKAAFTAQLPTGTAISSNAFANQLLPPNKLSTGWSLIATGDNPTPRTFVNAIATSPPATPNVAATSLTTLWAWDSVLSSWYFYAPSLDNSAGLAGYITTKGYLNFGTKTLTPDMGFWVNHP